MGLDLTVREQVNFSTNEKGQRTWQVVELFNFRNCHKILDQLERRLEGTFDNCSTYSFTEGQFFGVLHNLEEDLKELETDNGEGYCRYKYESEDDYNKRVSNYIREEKADISANIKELKEFIAQENLQEQTLTQEDKDYGVDEQYGRTFEVHAWW